MVMKPAWLEGLTGQTFFEVCGVHEGRRKNEKNIFCLNCCRSICPHCLPAHRSHPLLQVRRYVYNDVVQLGDLEKLIDCSYIQPYTINSAKVVFLNQRPQTRQFKRPSNSCLTCDRILQDPFRFCSLSCKVDHVVMQGGDLSSILYRFDESDFAFSQFEDLRMDSSSAMEEDLEDDQTTSNSEFSLGLVDVPKKKRGLRRGGSGAFFPGLVLSLSSRRKGAPKRSPLS